MMKKMMFLALAFALVATPLMLTSCGKDNPVAPTIDSGSMNVVNIARQLSAGPVDSTTMNKLYLWTDEDRASLKAELLKVMNLDQVSQRADIFSIIGPVADQSVLISDLTMMDQKARSRLSGPMAAQEYIAIGGLPQYSQRDPTWSSKKLGFSTSSTIGQYGCYLTCISMLTSYWGWPGEVPYYLNDWKVGTREHYPFLAGSDMIRTAEAIQYPGVSRSWSYFGPTDYEGVRRQLRVKHPVVVKTNWGGTHFMLVYCWDGTNFWVLDPWQYGGSICRKLDSTYGSIIEFRLLGYNPV